MLCELYFKKKLIVRDKKRNYREEILGYVWQFSSMRESLAPWGRFHCPPSYFYEGFHHVTIRWMREYFRGISVSRLVER